MKIILPQVYSQFDDRWAKLLLGNNLSQPYNFYNYGCLLVSLTEVASYFGHDLSPIELNEELRKIDGFTPASGEYVHGSLTRLFPEIQEKVVKNNPLADENVNEIKGALDQGFPVIVGIDYNPKTLEAESHYSLLVDYDPQNENNFSLADTLGGRVHSLRDYLGFLKPSARKSIFQYFVFSGPVPSHEVAPVQSQPEVVQQSNPLPANYADIVHNSAQWDDLVKYLELGKSPESAMFEDAKKVIAGYKSRVTDLGNQKTDAQQLTAEKDVIIESQRTDISRLRDQVAQLDKLRKAEVDNLKKNIPTFDTLQRQYEGVVKEMQGTIDSLHGENKDLKIQIAHKDVEAQGEASMSPEVYQSGSNSATTPALVKNPTRLFFTLVKNIVELKV